MDFQLSIDQLELQEAARKFAQTELPDIARELEATDTPPSKALLKEYAALGFLGINIPEELGGLGLGNLEALLVLEEFAKVSSAVAFPVFESCVGPVQALIKFGHESLVKRLVPKVCAGETIIAVCMSEPDAGSALTDLKTRADIKDNHVLLNGTKRWCSGGGHSDAYIVYSRLSDQPGAKGIGAVLVEKDSEGLSFGAPEELMGFRGVPSADIYLDNVKAPLENIIVQANGGFQKLMEAFDLERCGNATMALGQASGSLEEMLPYIQERKQFGKAIIDFQAVQLKVAEMKMNTEAARLLIHRAASNSQNGFPSVLDSSVAKCFSNEMSRTVCGDALQLMGAYGYSKQHGMERRLRDAWGWGIAGGSIDIQKTNISAAMVGRRFNQRA
jgi:alkylation response protein AidB-like acyl-CoA dehydrogenase